MTSSGSPSSGPARSVSESHQGSKRWAAIKPCLVLGLKAIEMALDGLPVPGAKGCVSLVIHFIETAELASGNVEALEALQSRLESLQEVLSPICSCDAVDVPDDVQKDVRNLAKKFNKLEAHWKHKLETKKQKRHLIRRLLNAEDDQETLTTFSNAVGQTIQDFLVITTTNGRIAAFREESKNREARALHQLLRAPTASYDSVRNGGANACLEGTRVSILSTIRAWATSPDPKQAPIFWLNGLAGIGKTTIAHSIASELDAAGLLGASFVFLRADDQLKDARLAFPTIAYQLAQFSSQFRTRLAKILELDPDCASKRLDLQFEKLILQPFSVMHLSSPTVIILDALDECEPEKLTSELLRILLQCIRRIPFLRVFITSRPEGYIREALDLVDETSSHEKLVLHEDIYAEEVENDIRLFLKSSLQQIWNKHTKQTSVRWPSDDDLDNLVKQSGKLFVYAATAVRFIGSDRALNLKRQLSTLLAVKTGHVPLSEPYRQLDGLYLQILDSVFGDSSDDYYIQRFRRIIGSIVLLERPLPLLALANLLVDYSVEEINETLYHLHSIIVVPAALTEAPRTYHLSFPNFITNADRCTSLKPYIDPIQLSKYLFLRCLAVLESDFVRASSDSLDDEQSEVSPIIQHLNADVAVQSPLADIQERAEQTEVDVNKDVDVDVDADADVNVDVDDYPESTHTSINDDTEDHDLPAEIRYADNYWCRHLMKIPPGEIETTTSFEHFIKQYLLKWLQRRQDRILPESTDEGFANYDIRLARDTFDIIRSAYRWAVRSGCSKPLRRLIIEAKAQLLDIVEVDPEFMTKPTAPAPDVQTPAAGENGQESADTHIPNEPSIRADAPPPKAAPFQQFFNARQGRTRREESGVPALDRYLSDAVDGDVTEEEQDEDDDWNFQEAVDGEDRNGTTGTSLFARGVVDRYRLAVFRKASTPSQSRAGQHSASGVSKLSGTSESDHPPLQGRGRNSANSRIVSQTASNTSTLNNNDKDGPWSVSVAENDAKSYSLYVKTPTHNLTLTRTTLELAELDVKLRHSHGTQIKLPPFPISPESIPSKKKSTFLDSFSRLAPPTSLKEHVNPVPIPGQELEDPFTNDTNNGINTPAAASIAAYLTTLANIPAIRVDRSWGRFLRVRTDDLESIRVERAIKRVRSDLAVNGGGLSTASKDEKGNGKKED